MVFYFLLVCPVVQGLQVDGLAEEGKDCHKDQERRLCQRQGLAQAAAGIVQECSTEDNTEDRKEGLEDTYQIRDQVDHGIGQRTQKHNCKSLDCSSSDKVIFFTQQDIAGNCQSRKITAKQSYQIHNGCPITQVYQSLVRTN